MLLNDELGWWGLGAHLCDSQGLGGPACLLPSFPPPLLPASAQARNLGIIPDSSFPLPTESGQSSHVINSPSESSQVQLSLPLFPGHPSRAPFIFGASY